MMSPPRSQRMRGTVLHVYGGSPKKRGSLEEYFLRLARALREEGMATTFVFTRPPEPHLAELYREVRAEVLVLPDGGRKVDPATILTYRRLFGQVRPSLINFHFGSACFNGLAAARLCGIRNTVWTKHSFYCDGAFYKEVPSYKTLTSMILLQGLMAKRLIAVSDGVKDELVRYHLPKEKISRIYLGVDRSRFRNALDDGLPPDLGVASEERVISCISQARPEKGLEYLVLALPAVARKLPAVRLLVVGGGPQTDSLIDLAEKLGVSSRITFCGVRNDVERIIAGSEFTVLPSLTEGLPLALLESLACGRAVIASAVGGIPEAVTDGVNGLLVPPGDPEELANRMIALLEDEPLRRKLGAAAAEKAPLFDVDAGVARTVELYLQMMGESHA